MRPAPDASGYICRLTMILYPLKNNGPRLVLIIAAALIASSFKVAAQQEDTIASITCQEAVLIATQNNPEVRNAELDVLKSKNLKGSHLDLKPTEINYYRGQIHSPATQGLLTVNQKLGSPLESWYKAQATTHRVSLKETGATITRKKMARSTKIAYNKWIFLLNKRKILKQKLESYREFRRIARLKHQQGDIALIEKTTAENKFHQAQNALHQVYKKIAHAQQQLRNLMNTNHILLPASDSLKVYQIQYPNKMDPRELIDTILHDHYRQRINIREMEWKAQKADMLPDISAGYFTQKISGQTRLDGWSVGLSLPLWFRPGQNAVRKARIEKQMAENRMKKKMRQQESSIQNLLREVNHLREKLGYYHNQALQQAGLLIEKSTNQYSSEDIEYEQYMQAMQTAYDIRTAYLETLKDYNQAAMQLEFYINPSTI